MSAHTEATSPPQRRLHAAVLAGRTSRSGFTLVELLVSIVLFGGLIAAAISFFTMQVRTFELGAERTAATQRAQQAVAVLLRDLRTAGTNTMPQQPWLVYASESAIAFHADHTSNVVDPFAVFVDPDIPAGQTITLRREDRITIPTSSFTYPDSTYWAGANVRAPAELLIFFFLPDTLTTRTDDFVLYRQVNNADPEEVVRHVLRADTTPFFQYYRLSMAADSFPVHSLVPRGLLPLRHTVPMHYSARDTGALARIDSIRGVRVTLRGTNGQTGVAERTLTRTQYVWFRNGNLAEQKTCGSRPLFGSAVSARDTLIAGSKAARVSWSAATDEAGGEQDVIRYVIWRTAPAQPPGEAFRSIPAGSTSYVFIDSEVRPGERWIYGVAAQDCTPALSSVASSGTVIIP